MIEAEDGVVALERYFVDKPDLVLLDLVMRGMYGLDVLTKLRELDPSARVVVISADVQESSQQMVQEAGAHAFLVKPVDEPELLEALERAGTRARASQDQQRAQHDIAERLARLTKRERQVCELVARGLLNKQIAYELGASENTVKVHRARVMRKLRVDSVASLVRLMSKSERRPPSP